MSLLSIVAKFMLKSSFHFFRTGTFVPILREKHSFVQGLLWMVHMLIMVSGKHECI